MAQDIKNVKVGQRFLVIDKEEKGFREGTIVEAIESIDSINKNYWFSCKWVGGTELYQDITLSQKIEHLKRFKGKIK